MTGFCLAIIRIAWSDIRELASSTPSTARQLALGPLALELGVLLRVRQQDRVTEVAGGLVRPTDDVGVEGVRDVGDDEGQGLRARLDEARQRARAVAEPLGRGEDPGRRVGIDTAGTREGP